MTYKSGGSRRQRNRCPNGKISEFGTVGECPSVRGSGDTAERGDRGGTYEFPVFHFKYYKVRKVCFPSSDVVRLFSVDLPL